MGIEPRSKRGIYYRGATQKSERLPYFDGDPGDRLVEGLQDLGIIKLVAKLSPIISVNHTW